MYVQTWIYFNKQIIFIINMVIKQLITIININYKNQNGIFKFKLLKK